MSPCRCRRTLRESWPPATPTGIEKSGEPAAAGAWPISMRAAGPQANALRERHSVRLARAVLTGYQAHYNMARPHQGIAQRVLADERDAHSASELLDRTLIWNQDRKST